MLYSFVLRNVYDSFKGFFMELKMNTAIAIVALVCGLFGGFGIAKLTEKQPEPVVVTGSKEGEKLADIDLVRVPCSTEFITTNGDLLCRELFCRMQQRGIDAKTSSADCAAISNVNNSLKIIELIEKTCKIDTAETDDFNKCALRYTGIINSGKSGQ